MQKRDKFISYAILAAILSTGMGALPVYGASDVIGQTQSVAGHSPESVFGGHATDTGASALRNTLILEATAEELSIAYGGFSLTGAAEKNTLEISSGSLAATDVYGGYVSKGTGTVKENNVSMNGGLVKGALYGAYTAAGMAQENQVSVSDGTVKENVYGGYSYRGSAQGNDVRLSGSTVVGDEEDFDNGNVYGGVSNSGAALANTVTLEDNVQVYNSVTGGQVDGEDSTGAVTGNTVTMTGGTVAADLQGGLTYGTGLVSDNTADLMGGTVAGSVYGGFAMAGPATGNVVKLQGSATVGINVCGAFITDGDGVAQANQVHLSGGVVQYNAYGAYSMQGDVTGNILTLSGQAVLGSGNDAGGFTDPDAGGYAGYTMGGAATNNVLEIRENAQLLGQAAGGFAGSTSAGDVTGNQVIMTGATVGKAGAGNVLAGGWSQGSGQVTGNQVVLQGDTVQADLYGGRAASGTASDNSVRISGGTIYGDIYGGYAQAGDATDNVVTITGGTLGSTSGLYGGTAGEGKKSTGNTLHFYLKDVRIGELADFQNLNFYVPTGTTAGETMLTIAGDEATNLNGTTIQAAVEDATQLHPGEIMTLITNAHGVTTTDATLSMMAGKSTVTDAGFVTRAVGIKTTDDQKSVVLYIPENGQASLSPDTKLLAEARAASLETLWQASNMVTTTGYADAIAAASQVSSGFTPYVSLGGFNLRHESGSYIDTNGLNANVGFVRRYTKDSHVDTLMPFFEYGRNNYTSHLDNGARADGNQHYTGGGILWRRDRADGLHYEAMIRAGRLSGDFKGRIKGYEATYDSSSPYVAAELGLGKVITQDAHSFDYYGKFFWTHVGSDSTQVHSSLGSSQYDFDSINSYRTRVGVRWTKQQSDHNSYYAGLGWDYEFDGDAKASYRYFNTPNPSTKGSSGFLEIGWQSKITKDNPWDADVNITGWAGKQRGVTYGLSLTRAF